MNVVFHGCGRRYFLCQAAGLLALLPALLWTAAGAAEPPKPSYPHINLSTCYEVDPHWPEHPPEMLWGAMPSIAVDGQDQVWLFTRAEPPVQIYTAAGKFVRSWGNGQIGTAHFLRFDPQGNVWVADCKAHVVLQFTPDGKLLRTLGTRDEPGEDATHFNKPTDMAITPAGDIYVSDGYANNRVVHFDKEGKFLSAWGKLGTAPGEFSTPHSIVVDSQDRLYVADRNNARIQVFDSNGKSLAVWQNLIVPWALTITKKDELWVSGSSPMPWRDTDVYLSCPPKDQIIMRFDTTGKVQQLWTLPYVHGDKAQPGDVDWLHGLGVDSQGNLYVGDIMGKRAQKAIAAELIAGWSDAFGPNPAR